MIRLNNDVEFISTELQPEEYDAQAKPLITITKNEHGKFVVKNDTLNRNQNDSADAEGRPKTDASNMMFVVVRNMKSAQKNVTDYKLSKGDTIKLGRLKFAIKDFRTRLVPANLDIKEGGAGCSPIKQPYCSNVDEDANDIDSDNDFHEEEAVEIDCGIVKDAEEENV